MAGGSNGERKNGPGKPFPPGVSGNPGGRSKAFAEFRAAVEKLSPRAVEVLAELLEHDDGKVRVQAVREVLDRSWGKAAQPITGEDGKPVSIDLAPLLAKLVG